MKRREFIKTAAAAAPFFANAGATSQMDIVTWEQFLRASAVPREVIDRFLRGPSWAQFDPELGYILGNYIPTDGIDHSATISTVQPNGARTSFTYVGRPCRINTYGNSFTQCHQVSDAETWQEYLAGHLGEPIRNFGMGGFGVYQSHRRMLREERTGHEAEYLVLYIWGDDHIRSLLRCRHAITYRFWDDRGGSLFHGNFWSHLEMDLESGHFVEKENLLSTPSALYRMSDPQFMVDQLKDDLALQLYAFKSGYIRELDRERTSQLAARLNYPLDWSRNSAIDQQVGEILDKYSLAASQFILEKAREFSLQNRKKLLVVLFDPYRGMDEMLKSGTRYDQPIVDYLVKNKFDFFDMTDVQVRDFKKYSMPLEEYRKIYFNGHYSPRGNHFFAYSIKESMVKWLDPKPITYRNPDPQSIEFKGYIAGYH
jgi:hypothetical protein